MPSWIDPQLATLTHEHFSDPKWIFERKLDGERCLAFADPAGVRLMSRSQHDITSSFPEVAEALAFSRGKLPGRGVHWVAPELVGQVAFTEWTEDGQLRHPRFQGLRDDKEPADVVREIPA